ncbi:MAG: GIY-YIG nuclease family protein [Bacillota bacterium]
MNEEVEINLDYDSGVYLLEVFLHKPKKIEVGALGIHTFPPGYYYYAGSAQKNLKSRIERHYKVTKKAHWHIDYLLAEGHLKRHFTWQKDKKGECEIASHLKDELGGKVIVTGFGSSDCECESHLIYFSNPLSEEDLGGSNFESK